MRDSRLFDRAALDHFPGHENEKVESCGAGFLVGFLGRDDDFGEEGWDEIEVRWRELLDGRCDGEEAVATSWSRGGRCRGEEEGLEILISGLKGQSAVWSGREAREELVGFLLKLGISLQEKDSGGKIEELGERGEREINGERYDKVHERV